MIDERYCLINPRAEISIYLPYLPKLVRCKTTVVQTSAVDGLRGTSYYTDAPAMIKSTTEAKT